MATIYDVSVKAGVSLATVSRVVNNNPKVSEKTRQKVLDAMKSLDYRPNSIAQSLASNRSNSVGILVSELSGQFYGEMLCGIENELRRAGKHVIIAAGHSNRETEADGIEFLISRSCDALILHVEAVSDDYLIELSKGPVPIIVINRHVAEIESACISLDNELGGYQACSALLGKGHREIAYIAGPLWKADAQARLRGHRRALAEAGLEFSAELMAEGDYTETGGGEAMRQLLATHVPFSALVCANDEMASGAMSVAREALLELPEQLSIVGFDNVVFARHLYPKLTTINYPIREMGRMAGRLTLERVYQIKPEKVRHLFKPELVSRDSVAQHH